jgi:glutaredoxin
MQEHEYMAVVYVDSVTCTSCKFNNLTMWKHLEKNLEKNNTGVLFVIRNSDEQSVIEALKSNKLTFPFIFDNGGKFKANNEIFKFARSNVFVMDRNKNVIMAESPIENEQTWAMFLKRVKKE